MTSEQYARRLLRCLQYCLALPTEEERLFALHVLDVLQGSRHLHHLEFLPDPWKSDEIASVVCSIVDRLRDHTRIRQQIVWPAGYSMRSIEGHLTKFLKESNS